MPLSVRFPKFHLRMESFYQWLFPGVLYFDQCDDQIFFFLNFFIQFFQFLHLVKDPFDFPRGRVVVFCPVLQLLCWFCFISVCNRVESSVYLLLSVRDSGLQEEKAW